MIDARHYQAEETLRNGLAVCIRAARPDDLERALDAFRGLEAQTVYFRFFGPKKEFSAAEIERFTHMDFRQRVMLLCTRMQDGNEIVMASATYVRLGGAAAEVAFLVEEDYHRLGIARRMLGHLATIASSDGITEFVAEVLPGNSGMLGVFRACGWPVSLHTEEGVVHVSVDLRGS
ncbi:MAG TPA: GNAT family N-acetyltransferase [Azonexus sp.]